MAIHMDIVNFTRKLDAVPVIAFWLDIYFSGAATLLLEIYYNYYHFKPGIKTIFLDLVFLKTLLEPFVDCYNGGNCPWNYILARFRYGVQLTFLVKYIYTVQLHSQFNYFSHDRTLKKCKYCGEYDKRTIENDFDFDKFQDCSCACKECGDLAKDCKPCRLLISTHFRYVLTLYLLDVLWCQPIKLIQVVSTSEFHEY